MEQFQVDLLAKVWLQINNVLEQNTKYKVTVFEGMVSDKGNSLADDFVLNFVTRNTDKDSKGSRQQQKKKK